MGNDYHIISAANQLLRNDHTKNYSNKRRKENAQKDGANNTQGKRIINKKH